MALPQSLNTADIYGRNVGLRGWLEGLWLVG